MKLQPLLSFYRVAVLPQFDLEIEELIWQKPRILGPDETAYRPPSYNSFKLGTPYIYVSEITGTLPYLNCYKAGIGGHVASVNVFEDNGSQI